MILDPKDPFYAPLWRRVLIVGIMLGWAIFEFANGALLWGTLFGGLGLWAAWRFRDTPGRTD